MKIKNGVVFQGEVFYFNQWNKIEVNHATKKALKTIDDISKKLTGREIVVTCGIEGYHRSDSFHPRGKAVDVRSNHYSEAEKSKLLAKWTRVLNPQLKEGVKTFDVILEARGEPNEHFHIENDYKQC